MVVLLQRYRALSSAFLKSQRLISDTSSFPDFYPALRHSRKVGFSGMRAQALKSQSLLQRLGKAPQLCWKTHKPPKYPSQGPQPLVEYSASCLASQNCSISVWCWKCADEDSECLFALQLVDGDFSETTKSKNKSI